MSKNHVTDSIDYIFQLDSVFRHELVVSGKKNPISLRGDTLIFDVAGFSVPEGAKLRVLLERIPGVEVLNDGRIMAQGHEVVRIKLNGKNFLNESTELALNSLSADVLYEIKLYKEHTGEEKATGVHHQEGDQVLDIYTSPDHTSGWMADIVGAGGNKKRYQGSGAISGFSPNYQGLLSCSVDNQPTVLGVGESYLDKLSSETNVNDVVRQGYNGIVNVYRGPWHVNVAAFFNDGKTKAASKTTTEYYWYSPKVFSLADDEKTTDTYSGNLSLDWSYNGENLTWQTKVYLNHSDYAHDMMMLLDTREKKADPQQVENYLERSINFSQYWNYGSLQSLGGGVTTMLTKKWGARGDNVYVSAGVYYTGNQEHEFSHADIYYTATDEVSRQVLESYSKKRSTRCNAKAIYTYVPLPELKLQLSYDVERLHDRVRQDVNDLGFTFLDLGGEEITIPSDSLNKRAFLTTWLHNVCARVQYDKAGWCATAALAVEPQQMTLNYHKNAQVIDSAQTTLSFLPEIGVTYQKMDKWNMSLRYMGRKKQPDILAMLPVWDNTDPLHRYVGNAGLKPEINHVLSFTFFSFASVIQRQLNVSASAVINQNAITQRTDYDVEKGSYRIMPVNVAGNWNASVVFNYASSFRRAPSCHIEWQSTVNGSAEHAFHAQHKSRVKETDLLTSVRTLSTTHSGAFKYKYRFLQVKPYVYVCWTRYWNDQQNNVGSNLKLYGLGAMLRTDFDCGLSLGLDCYRNCRAGYWDPEMNGKEWICNVEVNYAFLRNKSLEVKIQGFDLLQQIHSVNQNNTVHYRRETIHKKGLNSYFMFSMSFHFDRFFMKG